MNVIVSSSWFLTNWHTVIVLFLMGRHFLFLCFRGWFIHQISWDRWHSFRHLTFWHQLACSIYPWLASAATFWTPSICCVRMSCHFTVSTECCKICFLMFPWTLNLCKIHSHPEVLGFEVIRYICLTVHSLNDGRIQSVWCSAHSTSYSVQTAAVWDGISHRWCSNR